MSSSMAALTGSSEIRLPPTKSTNPLTPIVANWTVIAAATCSYTQGCIHS